MRFILFILIFVNLPKDMYSQEIEMANMPFSYENSVQVEILGNGFLYSINYERVILNLDKFKTTGQIGYSYLGMGGQVIPIIVNELISFDNKHLEFGLGYTFADYLGNHLTIRIGYRYQKPDGQMVFRAGFTPWFGIGDWDFLPWVGLGIGYNF